jgi:hypothetical protein
MSLHPTVDETHQTHMRPSSDLSLTSSGGEKKPQHGRTWTCTSIREADPCVSACYGMVWIPAQLHFPEKKLGDRQAAHRQVRYPSLPEKEVLGIRFVNVYNVRDSDCNV